jgi:hypothetical protein
MLTDNLYFFDTFFRLVPFWILPNLLIFTPLSCALVMSFTHAQIMVSFNESNMFNLVLFLV